MGKADRTENPSGAPAALIGSMGAVTVFIVGAGFAALQLCAVFLLPHIPPGQELEEVAA